MTNRERIIGDHASDQKRAFLLDLSPLFCWIESPNIYVTKRRYNGNCFNCREFENTYTFQKSTTYQVGTRTWIRITTSFKSSNLCVLNCIKSSHWFINANKLSIHLCEICKYHIFIRLYRLCNFIHYNIAVTICVYIVVDRGVIIDIV